MFRRLFAPLVLAVWLAFCVIPGNTADADPQPPQTRALFLPLILFGHDLPRVALTDRVDGFNHPVHITHAGDGSQRLFVVEQSGRIRILDHGTLLAAPFLDIRGRVSCCGERGLLSVAFPPDYAASGAFYVNYTALNGDTVVARYRVSADPNLADPTSEQIVLAIPQPYPNHNGGQLAFSPRDGYLYIGMGDGGSGGDPENRAQNPRELLGKLLRIDVRSGAATYDVPPSNPFASNPAYRPEIWAVGLRNPWRFSFDRLTGDLYIGDVGQDRIEEIDFQPAPSAGGENYGWRIMEGDQCYGATTCDRTGLTLPVATYDHTLGCSVTGGVVYRGAREPALDGVYLYADFCSGQMWGLRRVDGSRWTNGPLAQTAIRITSFGEDEAGEVYVADHTNGRVYRVAVAP